MADLLLAVDTSTSQAGLALYDGGVLAEEVWRAGRDHGKSLMPAVAATLARVGRGPGDLTAVAAARGPGSFTGLRVGLAVAQGLAVALTIPLYGIGSLEVLAAGLPPLPCPLVAVLEAGRGRYATAVFRTVGDGWAQEGEIAGLDLDGLLDRVRAAERGGGCAVAGELRPDARARLAALPGVWTASPALGVRRPAVLAELGWRALQAGQPPGPTDGEPIYLARS